MKQFAFWMKDKNGKEYGCSIYKDHIIASLKETTIVRANYYTFDSIKAAITDDEYLLKKGKKLFWPYLLDLEKLYSGKKVWCNNTISESQITHRQFSIAFREWQRKNSFKVYDDSGNEIGIPNDFKFFLTRCNGKNAPFIVDTGKWNSHTQDEKDYFYGASPILKKNIFKETC